MQVYTDVEVVGAKEPESDPYIATLRSMLEEEDKEEEIPAFAGEDDDEGEPERIAEESDLTNV